MTSEPFDSRAHAATDAIDRRLRAARTLAVEAGRESLEAFRRRAFDVERKRDGTVVTEIDRSVEQVLRAGILAAFPDDGILGEEHDDVVGSSGFRWILDPIDGTRSFVQGVPLYGTLVAVEFEGAVVAGVIRMPALDETVWAARGMGAWHAVGEAEPVRATVSGATTPADAVLCVTCFDWFVPPPRRGLLIEAMDRFRTTRGWSDCYAHLLVATGRADAVIEPMLSPWDVATSVVILAEAGGRCTDWSGDDAALGPDGLISNGHLHAELLALLPDRAADAG